MIKRVAVIGDIHACNEEFATLISKLSWLSLDAIWTVGDLIDRGPSSSGVIDLCIKHGIHSVLANHEASILNHHKRYLEKKELPNNTDKRETLSQLKPHHYDYIKAMPKLHVIDDLNLIIVHAGLWPGLPLHLQPDNVIRAQLIHPDKPGKTHWWGLDAPLGSSKKTEEELRSEGWERWYKKYDFEQDCIFGHSVFRQPLVLQNSGYGKTIGVDTGSCFGGMLTACIYENTEDFYFVSVKCKQCFISNTKRFEN